MADTVDELVRFHSVHDEAKPMVIDLDRRLSYRELDVTTHDLAMAFINAGVVKGTRVGLIMPNGVGWVQIAIALTRIGAVLVPLSTLLAARELIAQLRTASVQVLISVQEFRGHHYLDELRSNLRLHDLSGTLQHPDLPALRQVWQVDRLPDVSAAESNRSIVDALAATVAPRVTRWSSCSRPAAAVRPRAWFTRMAALWAPFGPGLASRCIDSETRLYLPMPFFWVGGFGSGVLSVLVAGATLITEEIPQPDTTLRLLERERVTLFRGWPDQAEALARHPYRAQADFIRVTPRQLGSPPPGRTTCPTRRSGNAVRYA